MRLRMFSLRSDIMKLVIVFQTTYQDLNSSREKNISTAS